MTELSYGAARSVKPAETRATTREALALTEVLDFGRAAAEHAGEIRAELAADGAPIGAYDVLVAGHSRSRGLTLVTHDVREFSRVPGLAIQDWM